MPPVGAEVAIHFIDHAHNSESGTPMSAIVYGRVWKVTDEAVTVDSWAQDERDDKDREVGGSVECFTIARGLITKIRRLEEA